MHKLIDIAVILAYIVAGLFNAFIVAHVTPWWVWLPIAFMLGWGLGGAVTNASSTAANK